MSDIPIKVKSYQSLSKTKQSLDTIEWIPSGNIKGIVQIIHGMSEHIERYEDIANFLANNGYLVIGHTLAGHGKTAKILGYFDEKQGWQKQLLDIHNIRLTKQKKYPELPYFILGHSMGSFLLRTYIQEYSQGLSGIILSGTAQQECMIIKFGQFIAGFGKLFGKAKKPCNLLNTLSFSSFNKAFEPSRTNFDWLSHDESIVDAYIADKYCGHPFTYAGYADLFEGFELMNNKKRNKNISTILPIYLFSGDKDPVGKNGKGPQSVYENFKNMGFADVEIKLYENGRHEMLNETNKQEVYNNILNWLNKHC